MKNVRVGSVLLNRTKLLLIILTVLLVSCKGSTPIYHIGDEVIVNNSLKGVVVSSRNWTGKDSTSDYYIMFDSGTTIWYDQEVLTIKEK